MRKTIIALALALASARTLAALTVDDYRQMQKQHGDDNPAIELQVRMYLDGLLDGLFMLSHDLPAEKKTWCIPDNQQITDEMALELFKKELQMRGEEYAEFGELGIEIPFSLVMTDALQRTYPCKNK
jgi:hypothetical protein